jgi:lipopolysaccharide transport system permease protein
VLKAFFLSLFGHRELVWPLIRRDIEARVRGSALGLLWLLLQPLLLLAAYSYVFLLVMKMSWPELASAPAGVNAPMLLLVGMMTHSLLAESLGRAPGLIHAHSNYVKRVVMPVEIFATVTVASVLFQALMSLVVLLIAMLLFGASWQLSMVSLPLVWLPLLLLAVGAVWLLAAFGVYLRDLQYLVPFLSTLLMLLAPVFFPLSAVPAAAKPLVLLNPLTVPVMESRKVLLFGEWPDFAALGTYSVFALLFALFGFAVFRRLRPGFADVL